jgi:hypothetical protein
VSGEVGGGQYWAHERQADGKVSRRANQCKWGIGIALDAKGIAYPVMSTVFRVSSAFDMANKVFGGVKDWAQSAYKDAGTCISLAGQHWPRGQKSVASER